MKNLLKQFSTYYDNSEEFRRQQDEFERILKTKEWSFFRDCLITVKGVMMQEMLSYKFTDLPETEKDVMQRTFYNINQILDYLLSPGGWIRRKKLNAYDLMNKVNAKFKQGEIK